MYNVSVRITTDEEIFDYRGILTESDTDIRIRANGDDHELDITYRKGKEIRKKTVGRRLTIKRCGGLDYTWQIVPCGTGTLVVSTPYGDTNISYRIESFDFAGNEKRSEWNVSYTRLPSDGTLCHIRAVAALDKEDL